MKKSSTIFPGLNSRLRRVVMGSAVRYTTEIEDIQGSKLPVWKRNNVDLVIRKNNGWLTLQGRHAVLRDELLLIDHLGRNNNLEKNSDRLKIE